jgi:hypothetical protein
MVEMAGSRSLELFPDMSLSMTPIAAENHPGEVEEINMSLLLEE